MEVEKCVLTVDSIIDSDEEECGVERKNNVKLLTKV